MKKFVWDSSALINIKEPDSRGYSPGASLWKDLSDGWIPGPYQNILPSICAFEYSAAIHRKWRSGERPLHELYIIGENERIYPIDQDLINASRHLIREKGFSELTGADLAIACIAKIENAILVTLDKKFSRVLTCVDVLDLNESKNDARYSDRFILPEEERGSGN